MEEQKISFWKRICISVKNVEKYQILAGESIKKSIVYLLKIMIIFSLVVSLALTIKFGNVVTNLKNFIEQNIEEINYKDNKLNVVAKENLTYYIDEVSTKIIINTGELTAEQQAEYAESLKYEFNGIMLLKDKVIIKNQMTNIPSAYNYSDIAEQYEIGTINKQDIIEKLSGKNQYTLCFVFFIVMTIYLFIIYFSSVLMDALVLAILGYITCSILKIKLKKMKKILCIVVLATYLILALSTTVFGATPKLVNKLNSAFEDIESWIIKISTPAAAVAVCTGALMRKFSFGDEEKIRTGKKLITGSLFSYAFILAIDLILSAIQSLIG